jgi:hypothetical protein
VTRSGVPVSGIRQAQDKSLVARFFLFNTSKTCDCIFKIKQYSESQHKFKYVKCTEQTLSYLLKIKMAVGRQRNLKDNQIKTGGNQHQGRAELKEPARLDSYHRQREQARGRRVLCGRKTGGSWGGARLTNSSGTDCWCVTDDFWCVTNNFWCVTNNFWCVTDDFCGGQRTSSCPVPVFMHSIYESNLQIFKYV